MTSPICLLTDQPILCSEDDVQMGDCHFHLRALAKNYVISGSLEDPCTRLEFPQEIKEKIIDRAAAHKIRGLFGERVIEISGLETVGSAVLYILSKAGSIPEIVANFDVRMNNVSLYAFDLSTDLSSYLSAKEEYLVTIHKGLLPIKAYKMYEHATRLGNTTITEALLVELTNGTIRKI